MMADAKFGRETGMLAEGPKRTRILASEGRRLIFSRQLGLEPGHCQPSSFPSHRISLPDHQPQFGRRRRHADPGLQTFRRMSKSAIVFLTRALAAEHVHDGVNVFAICPGAINTRMLQASTLDKMSPEGRGAFVANMPKGRLIEPAEIAALILFLSSSYAAPLHGSVIDASMGLGVRPGLASEPIAAA